MASKPESSKVLERFSGEENASMSKMRDGDKTPRALRLEGR
jgi:hypothetical protein